MSVSCRMTFFEGKEYSHKVPKKALEDWDEIKNQAYQMSLDDLAILVDKKFCHIEIVEKKLKDEVQLRCSNHESFSHEKIPCDLAEKINFFAIEKLNVLSWHWAYNFIAFRSDAKN